MTRPAAVLAAPVRAYRLLSGLGLPHCRYWPSCSAYALTALEHHGARKGSWLALRRLSRCHPWSAGGIDEVPPARAGSAGSPAGLGAPAWRTCQ